MSNSNTIFSRIVKGISRTANVARSTAKKVCGIREKEPFTDANRAELVRLVERLKMPFKNDDKNDDNVYALNMGKFNDLTIEDQVYKITEYLKIINGHKGKVSHHLLAQSYTEERTTKLSNISKYEFGIGLLPLRSDQKHAITTDWETYETYLSAYVEFIDSISCKKIGSLEVSNIRLSELLLPSTSFGGRRTKRHHTKRSKRSKRSKHTRRRKH